MHADSTRSSRKYACPILLQFGLRNHASISVSLWLRFCESAYPWSVLLLRFRRSLQFRHARLDVFDLDGFGRVVEEALGGAFR